MIFDSQRQVCRPVTCSRGRKITGPTVERMLDSKAEEASRVLPKSLSSKEDNTQ